MKITIKKGKGVLGKDKQPFAPRTLHFIRRERDDKLGIIKWSIPVPYSLEALLSGFLDEQVDEIQVITEANDEYRVKINRK